MKNAIFKTNEMPSLRTEDRIRKNINEILKNLPFEMRKEVMYFLTQKVIKKDFEYIKQPIKYYPFPKAKIVDFLIKTNSSVYDLMKCLDETIEIKNEFGEMECLTCEEYNKKYLTLSDEDAEFMAMLECLDKKYYIPIKTAIEELSGLWWEKNVVENNYGIKIQNVDAEYYISPVDRIHIAVCWKREFENFKACTLYGQYHAIPSLYGILPEAAKALDVSLHWLMCLDEKTPCFASNGEIDVIFDYYKLLTTKEQKHFAKNMILQLIKEH